MARPYAEVSRIRRERLSGAARAQGEVLADVYGLAMQIIAAREARGLTQSELAELSGIDQGDISRIERGVISPTETTLVRLAEALGSEWRLVPQDVRRATA